MPNNRKKKSTLRDKVLRERNKLDTQTWQNKTERIINSFLKLDEYKRASYIHTYISMNDRREVSTDSLINTMLRSGREVIVPITNFKEGTLSHSILTDFSELKPNKWGVREPVFFNEAKISDLDLVIVPMAAADRSGNRLGYGKGFYDRFLSKINAFKVGLVFSDFLFDDIPIEPFDEKLDAIITDSEVIYT